ncbi:unnamed protein product [Vicia faba]|uniref:riboflavin kinase n=1 Tax=Vicia faba TaxID=3906 RepID=A0AAV0Z1P9_VICFA|nr:unnamed protein product [Vicia faba]
MGQQVIPDTDQQIIPDTDQQIIPDGGVILSETQSKSVMNSSSIMCFPKLIKCVIIGLDGTLVNTDAILSFQEYAKQWDGREPLKIAAKTPSALPCSPFQCCNVKALPGANRLIQHLKTNGVPMVLASNSPRETIHAKISFHNGWEDSFSVIIGGDQVPTGKPSPDIFFEAARRLRMEPSSCLVIEDSLPGVTAGKAAEMEVVAVPSLPKQSHLFTAADEVINSLLDLRLENWGLPPFADWVEGTLPVDPWYIGGPVVKGFGRGSKLLGIPTANLSTKDYLDILSEHPAGVYFGWAGLPARGIFKMVMSIGWNPYFGNKEKTIEPWLLHEFTEDFYGEELRLVIVGYIRPERNFPSLESLIAKIHEDRIVAERALDLPMYSSHKNDLYLRSS